MWSIGNEIGEADGGKPRSLTFVKRLVQVIKTVDKHAITMGADKFRFGDSGDHENCQ